MTDNEIIKALENTLDYSDELEFEAIKNTLDLINRQKAEIDRYKGVIKLLESDLQVAKSETIKEFAERLWERLLEGAEVTYECDDFLVDVFDRNKAADIIDELVKEMTEVEENA